MSTECTTIEQRVVVCECGTTNCLPLAAHGGDVVFYTGAPHQPYCQCGKPISNDYQPGTFRFMSARGAVLAIVRSDGTVDVSEPASAAARAFWTALGRFPLDVYDAIEHLCHALDSDDSGKIVAAACKLGKIWTGK
jgi:hypothetical protein